jgi:lysyl-tRNA synthetase class 2
MISLFSKLSNSLFLSMTEQPKIKQNKSAGNQSNSSENAKHDTFKLREERLHKLELLKTLFQIDPYLLNLEDSAIGSSSQKWIEFKNNRKLASQVHELFESLAPGDLSDQLVWVAGRIHSDRNTGMFLDIYDESGKIQIVNERADLEGGYRSAEDDKHLLDLLDKGDIVAIYGKPYRTARGELSIKSQDIWILSKSILPPPEIIENKRRRLGLTDVEVRYRQRHLDLMVNHEVKETFRKRAQIISGIREFLGEKGFLEFETPILQTEAGGAAARPFTTHHNALGLDLYLRIATELHLKRLLVGGFEKVYEIGRIFRNEGISTRHNPEFTSVELYQAFADFKDMKIITEELISKLAQKICGSQTVNYQGQEINLQAPWRRVSMVELVKEITGKDFDVENISLETAKSQAKELGIDVSSKKSLGEILYTVFEEKCESKLIQPTFVTNYPWEDSPLAFTSAHTTRPVGTQESKRESKYAERFELFITGRELANGFTELNNPIRQREAFLEQQNQKSAGNDEAHPLDEDYIKALECAMPPAGGLGIGIDRLVMLLTNSASIRDVILFPTMKPIA